MKRDRTVEASFVMLFGGWLTGAALGMPSPLTRDDPAHFHVIFWITFAGGVRAMVLWFQTLKHGIYHCRRENRFAVVLGHVFLGPIMSYAYYYSSRHEASKPTSE